MIPYLPLQRISAMYGSELKEAAAAVIDSGRYLRGEQVATFEHDYAGYIGTPHCIGTGNGYDALWLILRGYKELGRLHEGDEVLVSAHTFIATIGAIVDNGLVPVFIDAREDTLELDETLLEQALTKRTRALMLVHLYGRCAYTERIGSFCREHNLLLIEDNAQAQGGGMKEERGENSEDYSDEKYSEKDFPHSSLLSPLSSFPETHSSLLSPHSSFIHTGSLGDAAAHSFYPGKNLGALGDGGAVTTHDAALASVIRAIANYGMTEKNVCRYAGRNSRLDELQAAMLLVKLHHLDADNARRRDIACRYMEEIHHADIVLPTDDGTCVYHIFPVLCTDRERLQQHLTACGVETLIHYPIPPHRQACYPQWHGLNLPVTERICREELSLPCHQAMTDEEVMAVIRAVNSF